MDASKIPNTPEIKLHFLDYWRIIRLRKTIIFSVWVLVVITATLVSLTIPEKFLSKARIEVEKEGSDINPLGNRYMIQSFDPYFMQTQFEIIESTSILHPVIEKLKLREKWGQKYNDGQPLTLNEAYKLLTGLVDLQQTRNTSLIEIRVVNQDPDEAALIANTIADMYKEWRQEIRSKHMRDGIKSLELQLDDQEEIVSEKKKEVDRLREELKVVDIDPNSTLVQFAPTLDQQTMAQLERQRLDKLGAYTEIKKLYEELESKDPEALRRSIPPPYRDAVLQETLRDYNLASLEIQRLRNEGIGNENPAMKVARARISEIEKQLEESVAGIMAGLQAQRNSLKASYDEVNDQVEALKSSDRERSERTRPYWDAKRELRTETDFLDILKLKLKTEITDSNISQESVVKIIDEATPTRKAFRPNIPLNIILGIVVGLMVGVGLAFFIEYLDTSVKTIDDVERALQAPVLGVIPQNVGNLVEDGPESPHAEAYRVLRTNILFSRKNDQLNTITVVSAGAGEGKSTTLFNLATVFAQTGERILIVDSDLRRPSLHKTLGVTNSIGLTNYLLRQNGLEEVIQTTSLPTLDFMPSGKLPSSSMGILSSPQMKEMIQELKRRYDFVFFDSPPIMGVSDASVLASEMDMTLQVIQYRRYPQQMTIRAKQMIEKIGGNLMGIVLNNISMGQDDNYYYYSGYYYDYYSKQDDDEKPGKKKKKKIEEPALEIKQKF